MFKELAAKGFDVKEINSGIYYITGRITFPTQVIVTSRLPAESYEAFKILAADAREDDVVKFMKVARSNYDPEDVSAILRVSMALNKNIYQKLREASLMKDVFMEIFHEEMAESEARGIAIGETRGETRGRHEERKIIFNRLIANGMSPIEAANIIGASI